MNKAELKNELYKELAKKKRKQPLCASEKKYYFSRLPKYRNGCFHIHSQKYNLTIKANYSHFAHCAIYELQSMQDIKHPLKQLLEGVRDCGKMLLEEYPVLFADNEYLFDESEKITEN